MPAQPEIKLANLKRQARISSFSHKKGEDIFEDANKSIVHFNEVLTNGMTDDEIRMFQYLLNRACSNVLEAAGEYKEELMSPGPPRASACCKDEI